MPVFNALQMLDRLRFQPKKDNVHVVMVLTFIDQEDIEKAYSYQMVISYLSKPLEDEQLKILPHEKRLAHLFWV